MAGNIHFLCRDIDDWTITFVETGADATIGERLKAVKPYLQGEEVFLANNEDGLSDVSIPVMPNIFQRSSVIASMLLVQPTASFDLVAADPGGVVKDIFPLTDSDIWINGGFFAMRNEIFSYMRPGRNW